MPASAGAPSGALFFFVYFYTPIMQIIVSAMLNNMEENGMSIFKKKKQKPALVLINPEAWNIIDTYKAIEAYRVKHRSIRRKTKEFEDGHKEVAYYTRNLWYQFYLGYLTGRHTVDFKDSIVMGLSVSDNLMEKGRQKAGVRA